MSVAVELLMVLKQQEDDKRTQKNLNGMDRTAFFQDLEAEVRKALPGIILFTTEERAAKGESGISVESQLAQLSWKAGDLVAVMKKWESEQNKKKWRDAAFLVGAFAVSSAILFLRSM